MDWVDRAKNRAKTLKLSYEKIAERAGVTTGAVGHWLARRREPDTLETFEKLAKALEMPLSELLGTGIREARPGYNVDPVPPMRRLVPLISWVQAGDWCPVADPYQPGDGESMVPLHGKGGPRTYALRVRGSSMEPEFWDGELIYVDPDAEYRHKSFVVIRLEDRQEATFKQLIEEGGKRYLKPINPDWPEKFIEVDGYATICGVVVGKYKEY